MFHLGLDNQYFGGTRLPFDLSVIGMTGCKLLLEPILATTVAANAAGQASLSIRLPSPLPSSAVMAFVQASHPEPSKNPANYVTTNMASAIIGTAGLSNHVYNWTSFGPTAQYGPYPIHCGQVMILG